MTGERFTKNDWKLFQEKLPGWQESFMEKLNEEYVGILTGAGNPSDRFWKLEERIREDKRKSGVRLQTSREDLIDMLYRLMREGVITTDDLIDFSDDLKKTIAARLEYA